MNKEFNDLFLRAQSAGMKALQEATPTPMVVRDANVLTGQPLAGGRQYFVADGVCGFAWVHISPGNCSFANWLKRSGHARKSYYGGVDVYIHEGNQSMERKQAYARAMAKIFNEANIPGVKSIYASSRMD
jgi:hypothetical protein